MAYWLRPLESPGFGAAGRRAPCVKSSTRSTGCWARISRRARLLRRRGWRRHPGRHFAPRVALARELVSVVVERAHVGGVELLLVHHGELRPDEGEIEVDLVLLRRPVNSVEIADPFPLLHPP